MTMMKVVAMFDDAISLVNFVFQILKITRFEPFFYS